MQGLSRSLLIGVFLFLVVVVGLLVARGRTARIETTEVAPTSADYRIKEIRLQEEARDGVRWRLAAEQAEIYEELGKTVMKDVTITIEQPERTWTVRGDEGELVQSTKNVEVRGRVVLTSTDGLRLETTRLRWSSAEQKAWTDVPVTIYRPGTVVRGQGLEAFLSEHRAIVKGPVHATFTGLKSASRASEAPPSGGAGG
jgi:LPS export ABC transporter protein LptC